MGFGRIQKTLKVLSVLAASAAPADESVGKESSDFQHSSVQAEEEVVVVVVAVVAVVEAAAAAVGEGQKQVSEKHC